VVYWTASAVKEIANSAGELLKLLDKDSDKNL
jgi:hypothetical protein